jgi:muramoyltetrapeptide carboxypeptidase
VKEVKKRKWLPLVEGDHVDIVAPGWATEAHIPKAASAFLRSWGLIPRVPTGLLKPHFLGSHTREKRFDFLKDALLNPQSKVIWCLRGGYGSLHLLEKLAALPRPRQVKLLIGISDMTSLHSFLAAQWNWPSLHGPLLDRVATGKVLPVHMRELKQILFGEVSQVSFKKLKPLNQAAQKRQVVTGPVVGGNLTVFQSLVGTPYQVSLKGKILFLEDIGERAYRVDRALEQLWQAGPLKQISALVFGDFIGGMEKNGKDLTSKVMKIWAERLSVPVLKGLEAGHKDIQRPVPLLTSARLNLGESPLLVIESGI